MLASELRQLDFGTAAGHLAAGLVPVREAAGASLRVEEVLALRDARAIGNVDYVLFRRFGDGRSSQLVAYVVDNLSQGLSESAVAELHKRTWLHGGVPLIYVAWPARVDILSCARGADFWAVEGCRYNPADQISGLLGDAVAVDEALARKRLRYSALRLVDGTFWDDPGNSSLAKSDERAHEALITAVVETDAALEGETRPELRQLLLLTVLVKYLEDRRVFPSGWFGRFCAGATSFFDALRSGDPIAVSRLLRHLERRFNGDIFSLAQSAGSELTRESLEHFATLVEARTIRAQRYLWEQFSFEHIPVEIISHLYQRFVKGGHGTVYTPPFLANLLLDYAMPYDRLTGRERILDPACGSGVFLVGAYRRLVTAWRLQNEWETPNVAILKEILTNSIFGVELDANAINLTVFSLALAVCDALKPEVIWRELTFDRLKGRNLVAGDFFERRSNDAVVGGEAAFDLILGNPPFQSSLTEAGRTVNRTAARDRGPLPDSQAAYLFLEQALANLRPGGRLCLVQPSGILYNRLANRFRSDIIRRSRVDAVLDFTSIRNLFDAADPKVIAFLVSGQAPSDDHVVSHITFRRTFGTRQRICFEIDHYDHHAIPQTDAVKDRFVWRLNLLGGGRLHAMSKRLRGFETLESRIKREGLIYGEGFIVGNQAHRSFLTGMPFLPAEALTSDGIDTDELSVVRETQFEAPRDRALYDAPVVLIRKHNSLPTALWRDGPLAFTSTIVAIGKGRGTLAMLRKIADRLNRRRDVYRFACAVHGSKALVDRATAILKQDIDALPFPEDEEELKLAFWEEVIQDDVLRFMGDFVRLGQNSELLERGASVADLEAYVEVFCNMLGSVYEGLLPGQPVFVDGLICQPFSFGGDSSPPSAIENLGSIRRIIYGDHHEQLRTIRLLRLYAGNTMLMIKPDRLRFWIRSTAVRDADETLSDLTSQGY